MRRYTLDRIVAALTDLTYWYIFDCEIEQDYKLKISKFALCPINTQSELTFITKLIEISV